MDTWCNSVTAFVQDPNCRLYSALFVALAVSALAAYAVLWVVARTMIATVNVMACWVVAVRRRLPRKDWACSPRELWRASWCRCTLEHMVENCAAAVS